MDDASERARKRERETAGERERDDEKRACDERRNATTDETYPQ